MKPLKLSLSICFLLLTAPTAWAAPPPPPILTHGPIVGNVTPTSATVFIRTSEATSGYVRVVCCAVPLDASFTTAAGTDLTALVAVSGLVPAISYTVQVFFGNDTNPQTSTSTFKTFPVATSISSFTFVVLTDFAMGPSRTTCSGGQGFKQCPDLNAATFASADAEQPAPAFVIIGGDFDHRDPAQYTDPDCGTDRPCKYRKMWKDLYHCENWGASNLCGRILQKYPLVHAWDDHDYSKNDGTGTYSDKVLARDMFRRYFPSYPLPGCGDCAGIWQKVSYAYADFFILDSRSQRCPTPGAQGCRTDRASMLDGFNLEAQGQGQMKWLKDGLAASPPAAWKFIWSPVVFNQTLVKPDSWYGYPAEQAELVGFITTNNIKNVIILSGDLHVGAIDDGTQLGHLPEMVSPAVNFTTGSPQHCQSANDGDRGRWSNGMYTTGDATTVPCNGYGVISVTPNAVTLTIKNELGSSTGLPCTPTNFQPCRTIDPHPMIVPLMIPKQ